MIKQYEQNPRTVQEYCKLVWQKHEEANKAVMEQKKKKDAEKLKVLNA